MIKPVWSFIVKKKQTYVNFLSKEPAQFQMQSDYVFPEVDFRTCCYNGVSFQYKADKIMDNLYKIEASGLLCNTRNHLLVSCSKCSICY